MSPVSRICLFLIPSIIVFDCPIGIAGICQIPPEFHGEWYSWEPASDGDVFTIITESSWRQPAGSPLECQDIYIHNRSDIQQGGRIATMLMKEVQNNKRGTCFFCVDVLERTPNVLQYNKQECIRSDVDASITISRACRGADPRYGAPRPYEYVTMFKRYPSTVNCKSMVEGYYQFSYEFDYGGGDICDNPNSTIQACQVPGSPYVDNHVFLMTFRACDSVYTSRNESVRYQCLGSWSAREAGIDYTFAAVADTVEKSDREKYKCLMTMDNDMTMNERNQARWAMSRFPVCYSLHSLYIAPVRLVLTKKVPPTDLMIPKCNLPSNITGDWIFQGLQFTSSIRISETHVYVTTGKNEPEPQESHYSCQRTSGTRYLMTRVAVGKCDVDFVCLDMRRNGTTVQLRIGGPSFVDIYRLESTDYVMETFDEACDPMSFIQYEDGEYDVLMPKAA